LIASFLGSANSSGRSVNRKAELALEKGKQDVSTTAARKTLVNSQAMFL